MARPAAVPITWVAGDDESVSITICSDADGETPVNITGRTYAMTVAATRGASASLSLTGAVTGASGLVVFTATDTQTTTLGAGSYWYDVVETSGTSETTLLLAPLEVVARVTA